MGYLNHSLPFFLYIIGIFCLGGTTSIHASPNKLDSLKTACEATTDPVKKIQLLLQICDLPDCRNLELAFSYAQKAVEYAKEAKEDTLLAFSQFKFAEIQYKLGKLKESEQNLTKALLVFEKYQFTERIALVQNSFGIINGMRQNHKVALSYFNKTLKMTKSKHLKIRVYNNLVQVYQSTGKYGQAFDCINSYSAIAEEIGDSAKILNSHFLMAMLYVRQRNLPKSQEYLIKIIPLVKTPKAKYRLADIYHNTAVSLIQDENYIEAAGYNQKGLELRLELGDKVGLAKSYINSSIINTKMQKFPIALEHLTQGYAYSKGTDNNHQAMVINYSILAFILDSMNTQYDESVLKNFDIDGLDDLVTDLEYNCNNTGDFCLSSSIQTLLLKHYLENNNLEKAFHFQARLSVLKDSIFQQRQRRSVSELDFILYTKDKEKQLSNKAREIAVLEKDKLQKQAFLLIGTAAFLVLLIVLILLNSKRKQLKKEKELADTQLENAQLILSQKKQELTHFAQQIIYKNTLITQLETDIESISDAIPDSEQQEKIGLLRHQTILTQEDWDSFRALFEEVYPNFIDKINQKLTKLTPAELRMFMLVKLGLSKQQIAGALGISAESVRKTKYRLKKKLELTAEQELDSFAQSFE